MPGEPDLYQVLGVPADANPGQIKAAYRRQSRVLHPDRNAAADATRQMARLNDAYAVLSDPSRRERYDLSRPRRIVRVRTETPVPPESGPGSLQPERFPDWYEFLGLRVSANSAEVLQAAAQLGRRIRAAGYASEVHDRLLGQLRTATEWLTTPSLKAIYDAAWDGTPPAAGTHAHLHADYYSFLGVRPNAAPEKIADRVTQLSGSVRYSSREYHDLTEAWKTLRDPERRAEYDRTLAAEPNPV